MSTKIEVVEHPNYRTIIANGALLSHQPSSFQMILYSEELKCDDMLVDATLNTEKLITKRITECRIFMDASTAKVIQGILNTNIANYEQKYGKIPSPTEVANKDKTNDANTRKKDDSTVYT
jgi:hypothetical protein